MTGGTVSDQEGRFELKEVPKGEFYIQATFLGYKPFLISDISVDGRSDLELEEIILEESSKMLEEVTVQGRRSTAIHKIDRQVYGAEQFQNATGGSATDVIRNIPSIALDAEGNISVRGATGLHWAIRQMTKMISNWAFSPANDPRTG